MTILSDVRMYYRNKIESLQNIFGTRDVEVEERALRVGSDRYPIVNDVIILTQAAPSAPDIQFTFGQEWQTYSRVLPAHHKEFAEYFDLVDTQSLAQSRVCDLGCGMGRWSYWLKDAAKELILVDFSDAIFAARKNFAEAGIHNALFFKGDLTRLPFTDNFADFLFCLGVLHHLPTPCLDEVRRLKRYAPRLLIFLYYALDNRPWYFRMILKAVTGVRLVLCRIRFAAIRKAIARAGVLLIYVPLISLGRLLKPLGLARYVPLYEFYHDKSLWRIEQDVYDRFFTRIEQRVSRAQIMALKNDFSELRVSDHMPYWHFLCVR